MTNTWKYEDKVVTSLEDLPNYENLIGFTYMITNLKTGKFYIGKKQLYASRKTVISKKEKAETKTRKKIKHVVKQSNWLKYFGSSKELLEDIKEHGEQNFERQILELCCTKKFLAYSELRAQLFADVLNSDSYNGNILGRYYRRDMENCNLKTNDL